MAQDGNASFQIALLALRQHRFKDALLAIQSAADVAVESNNLSALACCMSVQIDSLLSGRGPIQHSPLSSE